MELKPNMYLRTKQGKISKIKWISSQAWKGTNTIDATIHLENDNTLIYPRDDFKSSYNIIDLIEAGDYVNGNKVIRIETSSYPEDKNVKIIVCCGDDDYYVYYNEDIKTILTKEQYENNCYKVDDK